MSDEVAVLRAAGLESAAKLIEAARAGAVEAQSPAVAAVPAAPPAAGPATAVQTPGQLYAAEQAVAQAPPTVTREQLQGMSAQQIAKLPQEAVNQALAADGS